MTKSAVLKYATDQIERAMLQNGPYTHNIISLCLRKVANEISYDEANKLVKRYNFKKLYGISTEKPHPSKE